MTQGKTWMLYGATGYTGRLVIEEAVRQGLRPVLAGRSRAPLERLSAETGLEHRVVSLENPDGLAEAIDDVNAVLHCAGPFIHTARPMVTACLRRGVHYLDITGEIGVFEAIYKEHERAVEAGVVLMPGVGFDVVPTDAVAARLSKALPTSTHLELAFSGRGGVSRGTTLTALEGLPHGNAERLAGKLVPVPTASVWRDVPFADRTRSCVGIPWGDLSSAWRTTGIPHIRTYMGMRRSGFVGPGLVQSLLKLSPVRAIASAAVRTLMNGPSEQDRATGYSQVWGEARDPDGRVATLTLSGPEAYTLTALAGIAATERVAAGEVAPGAWTPSSGLGSDFVESLEGVRFGELTLEEPGL